MPTHMVNMDALIPRDDFEALSSEPATQPSILSTTMKITDLGPDSLIYNVLRKPDFQRETANWNPEKVAELVRSFLEGDLIPSVILWRSPISGNIFVIDGAHRLSALIAWVHDDYGDQHASIRFFDNNIPAEQNKAAQATRKLIQESVGSYRDLNLALRNSDTAPKDRVRLARNLSAFAINLQWVSGGAEKAESSFFRINQQATPIDPTELEMIKARRKPNALAARAFIRAGTGHKYWSTFSEPTQEEIESIAKDVYDLIFRPSLDSAVRTADLPVAGRGYSADSVRMVFELVNFVNNLQPDMWREDTGRRRRKRVDGDALPALSDDEDGSTTLQFMKAVKRAAGKVAGNEPASLGLHPAVYFYSATGRFQPAAFLAAVAFVKDLADKRKIASFTDKRAEFEEFLVRYKYFLNQIVRSYGSLQRSVPPTLLMYQTIFGALLEECSDSEIIGRLKGQSALRSSIKEISSEDRAHGRNFSAETKNSIVLKEAIQSAPKCGICRARLYLRFITVDHKVRKEDGGDGTPENGQLTHPYCNSGYKEGRHASARET
ncbi:GmrSD restriction endonuclease domain-containing protein [Streptomyces sp. ESR1.13]|uniref:GmrSD restriction endonuclease domain-containing protein n=1 Tax=unclassified Streptomyces TaxID=2593676 RepID=UPI004041F3CC